MLIPIVYLKGVSTGDFEEALITLLGKGAGGLGYSPLALAGLRAGGAPYEDHELVSGAQGLLPPHKCGSPTRVRRYFTSAERSSPRYSTNSKYLAASALASRPVDWRTSDTSGSRLS